MILILIGMLLIGKEMEMRDLDWKILYELYKNPNLTQVAKLLYLTQPTLTKRLKQLEEELDTSIVNRTPKGLTLTETGRYLGEKAGEYLQFREEISGELQKHKENKVEYIHIGSAYTFTKYMLRPLLDPFTRGHLGVNFRVANKQSNILHQMLLDGSLDAAFVRGDYTQGVARVPVAPDFGYVVTKGPVGMERLPGMNRIMYQTSQKTSDLLDNWWKDWFGEEKYRESGSAGYVDFALNSIVSEDDYVLCFFPGEEQVPRELTAMPMKMRDGSPVMRNTWFLYRNEKRISYTLEEFIRYIEESRMEESRMEGKR